MTRPHPNRAPAVDTHPGLWGLWWPGLEDQGLSGQQTRRSARVTTVLRPQGSTTASAACEMMPLSPPCLLFPELRASAFQGRGPSCTGDRPPFPAPHIIPGKLPQMGNLACAEQQALCSSVPRVDRGCPEGAMQGTPAGLAGVWGLRACRWSLWAQPHDQDRSQVQDGAPEAEAPEKPICVMSLSSWIIPSLKSTSTRGL